MKSRWSGFGQRTLAIVSPFLAILVAFTCLGLSGGVVMAQDGDDKQAVVAYAGDDEPKPPFPLNFDPDIFDETSTTIDNEWWPLPPGKQQTWEGTALEDGELVRRKVIFTVTDMTKEIAGVQCLIGWDTDYANDELTESELLFIAQAKDGTVWHLGESVEHYFYAEDIDTHGHYDGTRVWMVGYLKDCKAGIYMPADPTKLGEPPYSQGFAPHPWDWDDWAETYKTGQNMTVPTGSYSDVITIREYEPAAIAVENVSQIKSYARGVGCIKIAQLGDEGGDQETIDLVKNVMLSEEEMVKIREIVREHESKAYMYSLTKPAEQSHHDK